MQRYICLLQNYEKKIKTLFHLPHDYWMTRTLATYSYDEKMCIIVV